MKKILMYILCIIILSYMHAEDRQDLTPIEELHLLGQTFYKNTCLGTEMSIQDYIDNNGIPIISLGTASILNFDSQNIVGLHGAQNISIADVAIFLLSNNCIVGNIVDSEFPAMPFLGVPDINSLFLHNNNIEALPSNLLYGLSHLCDLTLAGNQLTDLPINFFSGQSLLWLDVSNNNFSSTENIDISEMSSLQIISLSNNPLGNIPDNYFQNNIALTNIFVSNNSLSEWPTNLLDNIPFLQLLDASYNLLDTFLPATISDGAYVILIGNPIPISTQDYIQETFSLVNFIF